MRDLMYCIHIFAIWSSSLPIIILFMFIEPSSLLKNLLKHLKWIIKLINFTDENKYGLYKENDRLL